jgi:anti-sigma regulatory factor (Ser/Thr protein kinase)
MNIEAVYNLFNNLHNDNLSFIYQGSFNDEITERIIDISETSISSKQEQTKMGNKVSFLLAECFQNVIRHGENPSLRKLTSETAGIFITRNIGKSYYISSANLIENKDVEGLKSKLEHINNLTPEELKAMYLNVLSDSEFSSKGGAGLGLIEMARKSGQKLDFDFETIDKEFSFFYLQIKLKSPEENNGGLEGIDVKVAKEFHHMMSEDNIFIINKGDFSQHTIVPILRMIEDNLHNYVGEMNTSKKKIFHALVEILQNVSKHAYEVEGLREGIFLMGKKDNKFLVFTGNYIANNKVRALGEHIENLNKLNREELLELYKLTLHLGSTSHDNDLGLGLIDVARDSSEKMQYYLIPVADNYSFYALGVVI